MFCVHHDDDDVLGADTVPCPFCGFGASTEDVYPSSAEMGQEEDSHDALLHAMALPEDDAGSPRGGNLVNLRHYW